MRGCAIEPRAGGLSDSAKGSGGWDIVVKPPVSVGGQNIQL